MCVVCVIQENTSESAINVLINAATGSASDLIYHLLNASTMINQDLKNKTHSALTA